MGSVLGTAVGDSRFDLDIDCVVEEGHLEVLALDYGSRGAASHQQRASAH